MRIGLQEMLTNLAGQDDCAKKRTSGSLRDRLAMTPLPVELG